MSDTRYLYAYFHGDDALDDDQQVRFAVSDDALRWRALNGGAPVLRSSIGDGGARDPFLVRLPHGGFVLIATDLNTKHPRYAAADGTPDWDVMQVRGSHAMLVWRSDDLVSWRGPESVDMAGDLPLGNVWAPKATFVPDRDAFLVYWSSACAADGYARERVYARWARDFAVFSDPFLLIERSHSCIDAELTLWRSASVPGDGGDSGDCWVLYLKNETDKTIGVYRSPELLAPGVVYVAGVSALSPSFARVPQCGIDGLRGVEGPSAVRLADGRALLYLDEYMGAKKGYFPLIGDDPTRPDSFHPVPGGAYLMPDGARHGSILPVSREEGERLVRAFG
ncbi:hypothetical protein CSQ85_08740 [Bifidobacterium rousetti]|uniref:glycoside hydrolase family 43 protein n=1 Tax=Bifidobacterium rousetti TaxID=2045439 RepID=UPI00123B4EC5|nr:glycoside hydrolase family 43 protein [Bifidobacterium rousetti]KAA8818569.1 hypothetical protein CSQ85_08740 [Bifidobacterium rousetti]